MIKPILKISSLSFLSIFLSIQGSFNLETKSEDQIQQVMKSQAISKNLAVSPDYGKIPLYFIPNEGQVDEKALFYAKASRYTLWLTKEGLVFDSTKRIKKENTKLLITDLRDVDNPEDFAYERDVSRLLFINSKKNPEVIPVSQTEHKVNYFIGNDKSKWRTNIQTSKAVLYKELYPNIDLKVYGVENQIEYDFIVKPGGEVSDINFEYKDVEKTEIDKEGNLIIETNFGELHHVKPECYQAIESKRIEVEAEFKKKGNNTFGFKVKEYDKDYELIIDPLVLVYSTYLGGSETDYGSGIAVDSEGAAYVTGTTWSTDFPIQSPVQGYLAGENNVFIAKINSTGTAIVYSTYLGGSYWDYGRAIAVDSEDAAYVTGSTESWNFPTQNPIQGSHGGGDHSVFVTKISSSGDALVYSTYLGGRTADFGYGIAVDSEGAAYVTGETLWGGFPTYNPIQPNNAGGRDAFITKINSTGSALVYSTYLGGIDYDSGSGIAVDSEGAAYITGSTGSTDFPTTFGTYDTSYNGERDTFVTKINSSGTGLLYSTYLGGGSSYDRGNGIVVDGNQNAYVTGATASTDFPVTPDAYDTSPNPGSDVFITKLNSIGTNLLYSTYLGGNSGDEGSGIAVDDNRNAYVTGWTSSTDFPTYNPIQANFAWGKDTFVTKIDSAGSALVYSTYLGGIDYDSGSGIAVDSRGAAYLTGDTYSTDFPTQNPIQASDAGGRDAFITKLSFVCSLTITAGIGGTTDPSPGTYTYDEGTQVTITAIPDNGYKFSGWSGDAAGTDNPIAITMDSDKSITANFEREIIRYTLSIESGPGGTTNPAPGIYSHDEGTEITITAIPDTHYRFSHWSGDISSSDNPVTIIMDSDKSVKANFIRQHTLAIDSGSGGTTNPSPGSYIYDKGTEVTITAIPATHYRFTGWSGDVSSTENPITIAMNSDISITANFIRIIYPPSNFTCQKVLNRSLSQAEYINVFSWQANPNNIDILKYRIYQIEGESKSLLVELNADTFQYWHRGVEKDKQYTYAICAVNDEDREGDPAFITVQ